MKLISIQTGGKVFARSGQCDVTATEMTAQITKQGVLLKWQTSKWIAFSESHVAAIAFVGATAERLDSGRNAGRAAGGAIAGALVLGPLGALAGAALGGAKTHTILLRGYNGDTAVLELTTAELQQFAARGLTTPP